MTTAERYILMGNLSMKEGKLEQAIISYRCAVLSGDPGQKGFALCRAVKCYSMLGQHEKAIDLAEKMISKFGEQINSRSLMEICAQSSDELGNKSASDEYKLKADKAEREKTARAASIPSARKSTSSKTVKA